MKTEKPEPHNHGPVRPRSALGGTRTVLAGRSWRVLALLLVALGLGLIPDVQVGAPAGGAQRAPAPALVRAQAATALEALVTPTDVPLPTATPGPEPTTTAGQIRPLSGPVMPRVPNIGAAPRRNPGAPDPNPTSDHVVVVDGTSGAVLFRRNALEPVAPASLTKIMTAILGIEHGNPADHVNITVDARTMPDSSLMGLQPGFDVTLEDLLYGLLLPSGNDAAVAIARYVAGNSEAFAQLMNEKARWLGLRATHFVNPHGLDASDHYSCPLDMVVMARYAMQYPLFRQIVDTKSYEVRESNIDFTMYNVNPILEYEGAEGVKTGLTDSAGKSLVAAATRNGHTIYVAFMRSDSGALADGTLLLNWAFNSFSWPDKSPSQEPPAP